jgi:hypothetical protein
MVAWQSRLLDGSERVRVKERVSDRLCVLTLDSCRHMH